MIAIGSDHGGFHLKEAIKKHLDELHLQYQDFGTYSESSCDYPDIAKAACAAIQAGECDRGLLFCGTGIGISMAANKCRGIRAACCSDYFSAKYTRLHNDANVLCLGGRVVGEGQANELVDVFLNTPFEGGVRHSTRIAKITAIEQENR
jgi:ribose 5-phosphate isomerase B